MARKRTVVSTSPNFQSEGPPTNTQAYTSDVVHGTTLPLQDVPGRPAGRISGGSLRPVGDKSVWADWYGGPNYAMGEREKFRSITEASAVMRSRMQGADPVSGTNTPVVEDSEMMLHGSEESDYPFKALKQTERGGIRREET